MKLLLDTSVLLWSVGARSKLNARATELLSSNDSELFLSSASVWEIAIKYALGALKLHSAPEAFIRDTMQGMGIHSLDMTFVHALEAARLPQHHRDPFDRMLIAQAHSEGMALLTADRIFEKYEVELIYCG